MLFGEKIHRYIYIFGLILLVVSLPLSKFTLSVSQFVLLGNWILEGRLKEKYKEVRKNFPLLIFEVLFAIHLIGLSYTQNFEYAFLSLKLKLPLLVLPIIIASTAPLAKKEFQLVIGFFIAGVFAASFIGTLGYFEILEIAVSDVRDIAVFIPHISLAVMINLSVFFLLKGFKNASIQFLIIRAGLIFWFIVFLLILKSITGIIILIIVSYILLIKLILSIKRSFKYILFSFAILIPVAMFYVIFNMGIKYFNQDGINKQNLEINTVNGNSYYHNTESRLMENGNFVYIYLCEEELKKEWNLRSQINFDSLDRKGNRIMHTLIRYMASKGLRKDSLGITQLSSEDIALIEEGYPNFHYGKRIGLHSKITEVLWQVSLYRENQSFEWNSIIQRYKAYQVGFNVFLENWLIGYGTGDVEDAFIEEYKSQEGEFIKHAYSIGVNQYLTFLVTFGILGFAIVMWSIYFPPALMGFYRDYYFLIFIMITTLTMFSEEMLKFQTGTTIFAFFYAVILFGRKFGDDG